MVYGFFVRIDLGVEEAESTQNLYSFPPTDFGSVGLRQFRYIDLSRFNLIYDIKRRILVQNKKSILIPTTGRKYAPLVPPEFA